MEVYEIRFAVVSILLLIIFISSLILQIFLSKKEGKIPGLVLPIIAFIFSFLLPLGMMVSSEGINAAFVFELFAVWLLGNIPTIIFLAIYFGCREKRKRNRQIEKMSIQDLD